MIKTAVTNSAKREFLQGIHQPGDVYKIALYSSKAILDAGTQEYTTASEIVADGYKAGGAILIGFRTTAETALDDEGNTVNAGVLTFDSPVWKQSTISARGAIIYNSSKGNKALSVFDFGEDITGTHGKFTATIPPPHALTGLICLE